MHTYNYTVLRYCNILKYKPGLVLPRGLWCCNYHYYSQWLVYGAVTWSLRFQEWSKQTQYRRCEDTKYMYIQLGIYTMIAYMFTPPISGVQETIWYRKKLWRFAFCQALKHSGRLIKSVPQAAAPIGSHTDKYSPSLSYITRKTERTLWSSQILFLFFSFGSLQEGSWCPIAENCSKEETILCSIPECLTLVGVPFCTHITMFFLLPGASLGWHNLLLL